MVKNFGSALTALGLIGALSACAHPSAGHLHRVVRRRGDRIRRMASCEATNRDARSIRARLVRGRTKMRRFCDWSGENLGAQPASGVKGVVNCGH